MIARLGRPSVGEAGGLAILRQMKIRMLDPAAYTPPYDHALCSALAAAGEEVELLTSAFRYGPVPQPEGYTLIEHFYRKGGGLRRRLWQHPGDMRRLRRLPRADINHFQWLPVQQIDQFLLPQRPNVLTAHDVVPREPRRGQLSALTRLYRKLDAIIVHSQHGHDRLAGELGVAEQKIHLIPHGAFDFLTRLPRELPLPERFSDSTAPVILAFGLIRPYKGTDLLIEALHQIPGAELWIVGMPSQASGVASLGALREQATALGDRVRFLSRFVRDEEIPAFFRRADIVALPYREIDQSGVLYTALAFGKPMVLSNVGGFGEFARSTGAATVTQSNGADALATQLRELLADEPRRRRMSESALRAAAGPYSWPQIASKTIDLYRELSG